MTQGFDPVQRALATLAVLWAGGVGALGLPPVLAAGFAAGGTGALVLTLLVRARRASERAAERAVSDAREMLQERLTGHLHLLLRAAAAPDREMDARERARLAEVVNAAREVEATLELLSARSLQGWREAPHPPSGR
jgi:hypothetical protein